ncbi:MAG: hypothetical protein QNJ97_13895 [Myxococcota bacterium]|nr:hypothetical protein [Myxococcota bacterium]
MRINPLTKLLVIGWLCVWLTPFGCGNDSSENEQNNTGGDADTDTDADTDSCTDTQSPMENEIRIMFLHHSTGGNILNGGVLTLFHDHNNANGTAYEFNHTSFPKSSPYGWNNYPYDYWNIWVRNAGNGPYMEEPTLEMLAEEYDVIIWKHCFPVSKVLDNTQSPDISSERKSRENYELQYAALKDKMLSFPQVRFIVWTGAALVAGETEADWAQNAKAFFDWVTGSWDECGDNIYVWDFWELETQGDIYMKDDFAVSPNDSHPNEQFSETAGELFFNRIIDVIEGRGDMGSLTGEK